MSVVIIIVLFVVALFVAVCLHELGHFIAAKRAGVKVEEFGIGIPPRLFGIKRGETIYSVNAIPIGAFVKAAGENDPTVPRSLAGKGPWTRFGIYAAGPLVNIFLAFVLLSVFLGLPVSFITGDGLMVHSVISPTSQFTPKTVETQSERDKLMFRIKVRVDPDLLANHIADVRTGLPGVAYIRFDPKVTWPAQLQPNLPAGAGSSASTGAVPK